MSEPMDRLRATADALELHLADQAWSKLRLARELWASYARVMNLVGPDAIDRQIGEGLHLVRAIELVRGQGVEVRRWADMGSGGGFPGLVLASCVSDLSGVLIEPRAKRCDFLELSAARLNGNWQVVRGRVEGDRCVPDAVGVAAGEFDGVSARAVWDPSTWLARGRGWVRAGGVIALHLHVGDPDPAGEAPLVSCASNGWDVRLYRAPELGVGP